jgi:hypothetical protein
LIRAARGEIDHIAPKRRAVQHAGEQTDHQRQPASFVAADR